MYKHNTYRLTDVLDYLGNHRAEADSPHKEFYQDMIGCIAQNIREDTYFYTGDPIMRMDFVQDQNGRWINLPLRTSPVKEVRELENGRLEIITMNSIYQFSPAELAPPVYQDEAELIELFLTTSGYQFAAGFYYDAQKQPHPLEQSVHLGMFQDSVLIRVKDDRFGRYVCRYFPLGSKITFYDTLYKQQDYSVRMLIHNNGKIPLQIEFQGFKATWTIQPGEAKEIQPFCADGADDCDTEKPQGN